MLTISSNIVKMFIPNYDLTVTVVRPTPMIIMTIKVRDFGKRFVLTHLSLFDHYDLCFALIPNVVANSEKHKTCTE